MGSTLLALDAGLNLERNFAGNRDWAFRFETAKPEWTVCFASVQVKDNRKFLLERKGELGVGQLDWNSSVVWTWRSERGVVESVSDDDGKKRA